MADPFSQGLGLGGGGSSHFTLEPGGKGIVPLQRAGPVAGEHQARMVAWSACSDTGSSASARCATTAASEACPALTSSSVWWTSTSTETMPDRRPFGREPILELGCAGDGKALEKVAGYESGGRFPVTGVGQLLEPFGVEADRLGRQPYLPPSGVDAGVTQIATQHPDGLVE